MNVKKQQSPLEKLNQAAVSNVSPGKGPVGYFNCPERQKMMSIKLNPWQPSNM
jgi:hypothetical protein